MGALVHDDGRPGVKPDRNLGLELVRVTEAAALASARWVGLGDTEAADGAAVDAMRLLLDTVPMDGVVVIGEGEKDAAPMLFNGERVGDGTSPQVDVAVDPLEGTKLVARGQPAAISVIAVSEPGSMFDPGPSFYMEKLVGGPAIADLLRLDATLDELVWNIAERKGTSPAEVTVVILDRERNSEGIEQVRAAGGRIRLIGEGDVAASLHVISEREGADLLWGMGGTPEGVLTAAAIRCMGGEILGRLWARNEAEDRAIEAAGLDRDEVLDSRRLVAGDDVFFAATGVTEGEMLQGVRYLGRGTASTESLVTRSRSGTVRKIQARHNRPKLSSISGGRYD